MAHMESLIKNLSSVGVKSSPNFNVNFMCMGLIFNGHIGPPKREFAISIRQPVGTNSVLNVYAHFIYIRLVLEKPQFGEFWLYFFSK